MFDFEESYGIWIWWTWLGKTGSVERGQEDEWSDWGG